jgi:FixJ family two-component response regulator
MFTPAQEDNILQGIMLATYVEKLPSKNRAVVCLIIAGFRQEEVARFLGISRTTIGEIYRHSINKLQKHMLAT